MFTEFYARPGGSNLNSGSSNNDAADVTFASGSWVQSTRVFTVASGDPSQSIAVGDFVSVYADGSTETGFVGRVTAVDSTTVTVSGTAIAGTAPANGTSNRTLKKGGGWQTFKKAVEFPAAALVNISNQPVRVNFASGTFNVTSSTAATRNVAGAICFKSAGVGNTIIDGGTGSAYTVLTLSGSTVRTVFDGFTFYRNGDSASAVGISSTAPGCPLRNCRITSMRGSGVFFGALSSAAIAIFSGLEIDNNNLANTSGNAGLQMSTSYTSSQVVIDRCLIHDNPGSNTNGLALLPSGGSVVAVVRNSVISGNGKDGVGCSSATLMLEYCDIVANGAKGLNVGSSVLAVCRNTNFVGNTAEAIETPSSGAMVIEENCGFFGNGSVAGTNYAVIGSPANRLIYTQSPYVDVDFSGSPKGGNFATRAIAGTFGTAGVAFPQVSGVFDSTVSVQESIGAVQARDNLPIVFEAVAPSVTQIVAIDNNDLEVGDLSPISIGDVLKVEQTSELLHVTATDEGSSVITVTRAVAGSTQATLAVGQDLSVMRQVISIADHIRSGQTVEGVDGNLVLPSVSDTRTGVGYGSEATELVGELDAETQVILSTGTVINR